MTEWIKCSDRLPEDCETVLAFDNLKYMVCYVLYSKYSEAVCWVNDDNCDENFPIGHFTYWTKLPEAPDD